jgi:hypothetical protein
MIETTSGGVADETARRHFPRECGRGVDAGPFSDWPAVREQAEIMASSCENRWSGGRGSNPRPTDYESLFSALATSGDG